MDESIQDILSHGTLAAPAAMSARNSLEPPNHAEFARFPTIATVPLSSFSPCHIRPPLHRTILTSGTPVLRPAH